MQFEMSWIGRYKGILILCLFVGVGVASYWNSFGNSFQFDDEVVVVHNRNIRTLKNIPYFFIDPKMASADPHIAGHYRPLVVMSYAMNYALGELNPAGYRLVNLAFHVGSAFMIFLIVNAMLGSRSEVRIQNSESRSKKQEVRSQKTEEKSQKLEVRGEESKKSSLFPLTSNFYIALVAGLIFLVHPFNSEAVNYITARSSVMSGFFYLLGFYWWVRFRSQNSEVRIQKSEKILPLTSYFYLGSLLAFVAGMLSKEVAVTLPIVLWLYDVYFTSYHERSRRDRPSGLSIKPAGGSKWRHYISYLPFVFIVVIPYFVIRLATFGKALDPFQRDLATQLLTELPVLVKHWQMFLIPAPLTPFHFVEIYKTFWPPPVISSALLLVVYVTIAFFLSRRAPRAWRMVSFFLFWFFIVLLPTTVIPLNAIFQENRGYLAIVSFAIFAGVVIGEIEKTRVRWGAIAIVIVFITLYGGVTLQRNTMWKDEETLWSDAVKKAPRSPEVYTALAVAYRKAGMYNQAIEVSQKALEMGGYNNFTVHSNLGRIYMAQERYELAAHELEMSIRGYPYDAKDHYNLGVVYYKLERVALAEKHFKEAVSLDPWYDRPYFNLGILYVRQGRLEDAIRAYEKAVSNNPMDIRSKFHIGMLLDEMGRKEEAAKYYRQVLHQAGEKEDRLLETVRNRLGLIGLSENGQPFQ